ncbi:MAG: cupredoxin family copper-binding protein [Caulobacterales bacterium]
MSFFRLTTRAAAFAAVALISFSAVHAAPAGPVVTIDNFTFDPMTVTVPAGGTVTWTNGDDVPHTVRAVDGAFHSKPIDTGESFSFTFAAPGVYAYFCSIHPKMLGKVIVKPQ